MENFDHATMPLRKDFNNRRNILLKVLLIILFFLVGQVFLFDHWITRLTSSVIDLKTSISSLDTLSSIAYQEQVSPPIITIGEINSHTIREYNLTLVNNVMPGTKDAPSPTISQSETDPSSSTSEHVSKFLEAYYYIVISFDSKPIKVVERICFNRISDDNSSNRPNGLIVTTATNPIQTIPITTSYSVGDYSVGNYPTNALVKNQEVKMSEKSLWDVGLCNGFLDSNTVFVLKKLLRQKGYNVSNSGVWDSESETALYQFQENNNLPVGNLNFITLKKLGLLVFIGQKKPYQIVNVPKLEEMFLAGSLNRNSKKE